MLLLKLQTMKKLTSTILKRVLVLIAFTLTNYSFASDFYWVNGSGTWDDVQHWSLSSGGSSSGQTPTSSDNVIFDQNSFGKELPVVFLNTATTVHNLNFSGSHSVNIQGSGTLTIKGDFVASNSFNINIGALNFNSNSSSTQSINTNNNDINSDIVFQNGNWELLSSLKTSITNDITFLDGEFFSNGHSIFAENIYSTVSNVNFDLTNSVVYAVNEVDFSKSKDKGNAANFFVAGTATTQAQMGDFDNSPSTFTKDQTFPCSDGNLIIDITTVDFVGGWNVSCNGECDGELTVIPSGTAGPYAIKFDLGAFTSQTVYPGLCTGNYLITVRDSSNELGAPGSGIFYQCSVTEIILEPSVLSLDILGVTQPTCPTTCDGAAFTASQGGTAPIVVTWINMKHLQRMPK